MTLAPMAMPPVLLTSAMLLTPDGAIAPVTLIAPVWFASPTTREVVPVMAFSSVLVSPRVVPPAPPRSMVRPAALLVRTTEFTPAFTAAPAVNAMSSAVRRMLPPGAAVEVRFAAAESVSSPPAFWVKTLRSPPLASAPETVTLPAVSVMLARPAVFVPLVTVNPPDSVLTS